MTMDQCDFTHNGTEYNTNDQEMLITVVVVVVVFTIVVVQTHRWSRWPGGLIDEVQFGMEMGITIISCWYNSGGGLDASEF